MADTTTKVREHYSPTNLTGRIRSALAAIATEGQMLTVAQLAPLDQFHTEAFWRPRNWPPPLGSSHLPACWIWAAASAAPRAISPPPSAVR